MVYSKEQKRAYTNAWREKRRKQALESLGGVCARCCSDQDLEFDHIDPTTKVLNIARMWTASEKKFQAELAKCQLLCRRCHLDKCREEGSLNTAVSNPGPINHGTAWGYHRGCRCDQCRSAKKTSRVGMTIGKVKTL